MAFQIELAAEAERDIEAIFQFIAETSPMNAVRWRRKLEHSLQSLAVMPKRCGLAPEDNLTLEPIRQLLFGSFRILFCVREDRVLVLTIRHAARLRMGTDELNQRLP